jgi:hypothetical protein
MRKIAVAFSLVVIFAGMMALFWHEEWVYSLPTPIPNNYKTVVPGSLIDLGRKIQTDSRPTFLHFFNPDCPCSRFNMTHFKSLVLRYGKEVHFTIVVMSNKHFTAQGIQERFGLQVPVCFDTSLAAICGVYSTPQAVIIDTRHELYYRGNYNKSRYCADTKTNYAQLALERLLLGKGNMSFDHFATTAYGCQLPNCTR